MNILVFNVGSTTLKFACIDSNSGARLTQGIFDRIGQTGGDAPDHLSAANIVLARHDHLRIDAIAHRIVQGADRFIEATLVSSGVLTDLTQLDSLAPLHNAPARAVVELIQKQNTSIPQVLVFDSAYYATLPAKAFRYAIADSHYRKHKIRRFGAHGTSHQYVTHRAIGWLNGRSESNGRPYRIISLHLGGGASATASLDGRAIETSMGMTPLEGLVMATRSGDIDPSVALHLMRVEGMSVDDIDRLLNKESGMLGLCGEIDMRRILARREAGDRSATLAIEIYVHRIQKYIGAYFAILGGLDALVFTAGVGENASAMRELVTTPLAHLGIQIDSALNVSSPVQPCVRDISVPESLARTLIVPTDEEVAIADETERLLT